VVEEHGVLFLINILGVAYIVVKSDARTYFYQGNGFRTGADAISHTILCAFSDCSFGSVTTQKNGQSV
jgi:hypothetical protein